MIDFHFKRWTEPLIQDNLISMSDIEYILNHAHLDKLDERSIFWRNVEGAVVRTRNGMILDLLNSGY